MSIIRILFISIISLVFFSCSTKKRYDICIYGGNSAGVIAAYTAAKMGKTVILIEPTSHLGGMTSSGLGSTDIGNKHVIVGLARQFYRKVGAHYNLFEAWDFEPSVAEKVFESYVHDSKIEVLREYQIVDVSKNGSFIRKASFSPVQGSIFNNVTVNASVFIDCSYEGDLMALAKVDYQIGREDNNVYGEKYNGVQLQHLHQFEDGIDPFKQEGNPKSGLLWGISNEKLLSNGTGDNKVQAYNYRLCWTSDSANRIPFSSTRPENYDSTHFELLLRLIRKRERQGYKNHDVHTYFIINEMPNKKTDVNHRGAFSIDFIGENHDYPEANYQSRREIAQEHENYIKGLLYFMSTDKRVPLKIRNGLNQYGWPKDEFKDNGGFPFQLYVREARRMIGEYVMTEHNCWGDSTVSDGIAFAAYTMDSHNCQRIVIKKKGRWMVKNEGNVEIGGFRPFPISYRALVPKREQCQNLLVPVCMSASHIAYGSIRMEPVFMVLAQVSSIAASFAIDQAVAIQDVPTTEINKIMETNPYMDESIADILTDNSDTASVIIQGKWHITSRWMGQYKWDYLFSEYNNDSTRQVIFSPKIIKESNYLALIYCPRYNKDIDEKTVSDSVTVIINHGEFSDTTFYRPLTNKGDWDTLGIYALKPNIPAYFTIDGNKNKQGIPVDALLLINHQP